MDQINGSIRSVWGTAAEEATRAPWCAVVCVSSGDSEQPFKGVTRALKYCTYIMYQGSMRTYQRFVTDLVQTRLSGTRYRRASFSRVSFSRASFSRVSYTHFLSSLSIVSAVLPSQLQVVPGCLKLAKFRTRFL